MHEINIIANYLLLEVLTNPNRRGQTKWLKLPVYMMTAGQSRKRLPQNTLGKRHTCIFNDVCHLIQEQALPLPRKITNGTTKPAS